MDDVGFTASVTTMSWPVEMPPRIPPAWFDRNPSRRHLVGVLAAALRDAREAGADLDPLHGVDPHHRLREVGVEPAVDRLAPADRHAAATTVIFAPQESPDLRSASMKASSSGTIRALATKNGFPSTCAQSSNGIDARAELNEVARG